MEKTQIKYCEGPKGEKSSKRLWGSILLLIGIVFSIIAFIISVYKVIGDSNLILEIIKMFLFTGASLLGIGIFDWWRNKSK